MTHILVIEDDPSIQMIVRKTLIKVGGFVVTVTEEVEIALTLARSGSVALIVMDVSLKNTLYEGRYIDGLSFARLLKSDPATRHIPILLATAHARPGDAEKLSRACGAEGYITKPFAEPKMLVDHIRQLLDKHEPASGS